MKKQNKFLLMAMSTSIILAPTTASIASAAENEKPVSEITSQEKNLNIIDNSVVSVDNIDYKVLTTEDDKFVTTSVTTEEGNITATRNKSTNFVEMSSDFLTSEELKSVQEEANSVIREVNEGETSGQLMTTAAASTWHNGKWSNYKITANGKFTVQTVIGVLGSAFGFTGAAVAGVANLAVQYGVKTGYYRIKIDTKVLDANYIMQRRTVQLYKDSKRTKLVGSRTDTNKVWAGL